MAHGGRRVAALVILLAPMAVLIGATAAGACPSTALLSATPKKVKPGTHVTVVGSAFVCNPPTPNPGGEASLTHIAVTFVQGSSVENVAAIDTGSQDPFTVVVTVPKGARSGPAFIEAVAGSREARAALTVVKSRTLARTAASRFDVAEIAIILLIIGVTVRTIGWIWET